MPRHLIITVDKYEVYNEYISIKEWFDKEFIIGKIKKTFLYAEPLESKAAYDVHYLLG